MVSMVSIKLSWKLQKEHQTSGKEVLWEPTYGRTHSSRKATTLIWTSDLQKFRLQINRKTIGLLFKTIKKTRKIEPAC